MKKLLLLSALSFFFLSATRSQWYVNHTDASSADKSAVATDPNGNIYEAVSMGRTAIQLNKYTGSGSIVWSKEIRISGSAVKILVSRNMLYVFGDVVDPNSFNDLDPGTGVTSIKSIDDSDLFLARYDAGTGSFINALALNGKGLSFLGNIAADRFGQIYIAASFQQDMDCDGDGNAPPLQSSLFATGFVAKYSESLGLLWSFTVQSNTESRCTGITVFDDLNSTDPSPALYVSGFFSSNIKLGNLEALATGVTAASDGYVIKCNAQTAAPLKLLVLRGSNFESIQHVKANSTGDLALGAWFNSSVVYVPGMAVSGQNAGTLDILLMKADKDLNVAWSKVFGGNGREQVWDVFMDAAGSVTAAGYFNSAVLTHENIVAISNRSNNGSSDAFFTKFDITGKLIAAKTIGGDITLMSAEHESEELTGITSDFNGNIIVAGGFQSKSIDIDPSSYTISLTNPRFNQNIPFLVKYSPLGNYIRPKSACLFCKESIAVNSTADKASIVNNTNFILGVNYPSPAHTITVIPYSVEKKSIVTIEIYDMFGRKIQTPVNSEKEKGNYTIDLQTADLPAGLYRYTMKAGKFFASKQMVIQH